MTSEEQAREFGTWLEALRTSTGRSRKDIADAAAVSISTLSTLEKGGRLYRGTWITPEPDHKTLVRIATPYGTTYEELCQRLGVVPRTAFLDQPEASSEDPDDGIEVDYNSAIARMPDHVRKAVIELARPYLED